MKVELLMQNTFSGSGLQLSTLRLRNFSSSRSRWLCKATVT